MFHVHSFYKFQNISDDSLESIKQSLDQTAASQGIGGLIILAAEGINGTVSGSESALSALREVMLQYFSADDWSLKISSSEKNPFKRFKTKIRREIVTTGQEQAPAVPQQKNALTPDQWNRVLEDEKDQVLLIDTRNYYETELGMFEGAVDPELVHFREFADYIQSQQLPKDKKILMYCTGGIRCEKAIYQMESLGYHNVFQLQGGILNYLERFPDQKFKGECFVFDQRVAVDQKLEPSARWALCPHCGQPGEEEVKCSQCESSVKICHRCAHERHIATCSKNCEYHASRLETQSLETGSLEKQRLEKQSESAEEVASA